MNARDSVIRIQRSLFAFPDGERVDGLGGIDQEFVEPTMRRRAGINAFLAVADPAALQAAADQLSPDIIRRRLHYGTTSTELVHPIVS